MGTNHLQTVKDLLDSNGHPSNVYRGPKMADDDIPDRAVFMVPTGDEQDPQHTFQDPETEQRKTVQVRIRGPGGDFNLAYDDARKAADILKNKTPANYLAIRLRNGPNYIGTDDERHEFSINILCWIHE